MTDVLSEARRIQMAAADVGFDWPDVSGALAKLREEVDELGRAIELGDADTQRDELGDVLFSAVNVSRFIGAGAAHALDLANRKFSARFDRVRDEVHASGRAIGDYSLDELDRIWERVKDDRSSRNTGR